MVAIYDITPVSPPGLEFKRGADAENLFKRCTSMVHLFFFPLL